jgi:hypothetical protein
MNWWIVEARLAALEAAQAEKAGQKPPTLADGVAALVSIGFSFVTFGLLCVMAWGLWFAASIMGPKGWPLYMWMGASLAWLFLSVALSWLRQRRRLWWIAGLQLLVYVLSGAAVLLGVDPKYVAPFAGLIATANCIDTVLKVRMSRRGVSA